MSDEQLKVVYVHDGVDFYLPDGRIIRARQGQGQNLNKENSDGMYIDFIMPGEKVPPQMVVEVKDDETGRPGFSVAFQKDSCMALYLLFSYLINKRAFGIEDLGDMLPVTINHQTHCNEVD